MIMSSGQVFCGSWTVRPGAVVEASRDADYGAVPSGRSWTMMIGAALARMRVVKPMEPGWMARGGGGRR